jgi:hypothetical protein
MLANGNPSSNHASNGTNEDTHQDVIEIKTE